MISRYEAFFTKLLEHDSFFDSCFNPSVSVLETDNRYIDTFGKTRLSGGIALPSRIFSRQKDYD